MAAEASRLNKERDRVHRLKRVRYVVYACNECRRRKVKCDGEHPCNGCLAHAGLCIYREQTGRRARTNASCKAARSRGSRSEVSAANINENGSLYTKNTAVSSYGSSQEPTPQEQQQYEAHQPAEFCGPSSSEYTLNVIKGNLKAMGISAVIGDASISTPEGPKNPSFHPTQYGPFMKMLMMDPLWDMKRTDALRLVNNYFHSPGALYPIADHDEMLATANTVFQSLQPAQEGRLKNRGVFAADAIFNDETNKLKVIIAIGSLLESGGRNDQAQRLFQSISEAVEGLLWNPGGINGIQLLVLVAIYHYHLDEEARTGRIVGFAARLCLEMGLHCRDMVVRTFPTAADQVVALKTFYSVYVLERRVSLGQGTPYIIHDSYVDPSLFTFHISDPSLLIMIDWTRLAGKAWHALNGQTKNGSAISKDEIDFLDYQIIQWYNKIPVDLQLPRIESHFQAPPTPEDGPNPLHIPAIIYLRKAHLRNLICRPVLQCAARIMQDKQYSLAAVEVAKEAIRTLSDLQQTTTLIDRQPVFFKQLLLTAFGNLLLAVVNAKSEFWDGIRDEFHLALRLIQRLSSRSGPLMRLWHRLKGLEELQTQMRLSFTQRSANQQLEQHSPALMDAAVSPNDLPSTFPVVPEVFATGSPGEYWIEGPHMRDGLASLFDNLGSDQFFDFPFGDFAGIL